MRLFLFLDYLLHVTPRISRVDAKNLGGSMPESRYDKLRKAEFRELARSIMSKDRDSKKYGFSVDTAGSIARALEQAYRRGRKESASGEPHVTTPRDKMAMDWILIPPRPRGAFWSICLTIFGSKKIDVDLGRYVLAKYDGRPQNSKHGWALCLLENCRLSQVRDNVWGYNTILPLIKCELLEAHKQYPELLVLTNKGVATWREAKAQATERGDSHLFP